MANRKQRRAQADHIHAQTEINRRLHRASNIAFIMHLKMPHEHNSPALPAYIAAIFSYLADDLHEIQALINKPTHTA